MIPRTFPSIIEAFQTKMVVYVLPSITGLRAWIDYIPVKGVTTESATLANTYANGGYQVVKSLDSLTGLQAWIGYIPVYEDAAYNKPWSTDAGGYIPVGGLFSIPSLFASGAKGVWYDPSDYSTLFQDSAGTTPVTAVEQPVGLMLDKSQGLVLGPERSVNGDFSNGTTGWTTYSGATLALDSTVIAGGAKITSAGVGSAASLVVSGLVVGKIYAVSIRLYLPSSNTVNSCATLSILNLQDSGKRNISEDSVQTVPYYFTATSTSATLAVTMVNPGVAWSASGDVVYIDDLSVKELPGNHAFQSTSASRPVLSARYNLLTATETLSDWSQSTVTIASGVTDPDGGSTALTITATSGNSFARKALTTAIGTAYQGNIWVRRRTGTGAVFIYLGEGSSNQSITLSLTTSWQKFTTSVTSTTGSGNYGILIGTSGDAVDVWHPSFLPANQSTLPYQRVNTATDYATTGFLPYLRFDGVDDSLSTNSISFTSTDKMSVFAGVRKLSDAAQALLLETSVNAASTSGSFFITAPNSAAGNYAFLENGGGNLRYTIPVTYSAPITNVLSCKFDLGTAVLADAVVSRINGVLNQSGLLQSAQTTGNFGNYPLYIGRRGGTSLPFNGQLYSMVIVGKAVTASELSSTETYVATKTGVTL